jgi:hypothetical protein
MALWNVFEQTHYLWNDTYSSNDFVQQIDDTQKNLRNEILNLFGTTERNAVTYDTSQAATGLVTAVVHWSNQNKPKTVLDPDAQGDYDVTFTAYKVGSAAAAART